MTFYPHIRLEKVTSGKSDWFRVTEDCKVPDAGVTIPAGYITDFASVPRLLWSIFPPHGRMANAAVLHDYMYDERINYDVLSEEEARLHADKLFLLNCIRDNVPPLQTIFIYYIIRLFGKKWWTKI